MAIVIATYNRPATLLRALRPAVTQTCAPAQIIVVDESDDWGSAWQSVQGLYEHAGLRGRYECEHEQGAAHQRISDSAGSRHWASVLCNTLHFSECILYGVFVEHQLDGQGHRFTDRELCHCSWHYSVQSPADVAGFFEKIRPDQVAVLVQSNLGIPPAEYTAMLHQLDPRAETSIAADPAGGSL